MSFDTEPGDEWEAGEIVALPYRLRWRPRTQMPGPHPAQGEGGEGTFRDLAPLLARPDPRRIDIRAFIRDPFENLKVRTFAPRRAVTVAALVDASASMGFGTLDAEVARLTASLAASAVAGGDTFTLLAADGTLREDLFLPPSSRRGVAREVLACLSRAAPGGPEADGLRLAAERLPRRRSLVFLISDFLMPSEMLQDLLDTLVAHDVVPVVVRDSRAEGDLPPYGLMEARDPETGATRLLVMHPRLRRKWQAASHDRLANLEALFNACGMHPFHLIDRFDPDALLDFLAHR